MAGPWERYAAPAAPETEESGPWAHYQSGGGSTVRRTHAPPETWQEYATGLAGNVLQGGTFNTADEIEAWLRSKFQGADYDRAVTEIRRQNEAFSQRHPVQSFGANVAGGVPLLLGGPGAAAARWMAAGSTIPRTMARSAVGNAPIGAAYGLGAGEGSLTERLPSAGTGAALGAGLGAAVPPAIAGGAMALNQAGRMVAPQTMMRMRAVRGDPPPVPPEGAEYAPGGQQTGAIQWIDNRAGGAAPPGTPPTPPNPQSMAASEHAIQVLTDAAQRAGISREAAVNRVRDYYRHMNQHQPGKLEAFQYHSGSYGPSTATLVEIFPELAETLGSAARQNPQVFNEASQFFQSRQSGVTPSAGGLTQRQLAERGVPTRGRFDAPIRQDESEAVLGRQFGRTTPITPAANTPTVAMGQRDRGMEHVKRLLKVSDSEYHGHAATPEQHLPQIIETQRANAQSNYSAAMDWADSAGVNLGPALKSVMKRWADDPEMKVRLFRTNLRKIVREFVDDETGQPISSLRSFDTAKKAADDLIGKMHQDNLGNVGGRMTEFKNELIAAVDQATERTPGANDSLYRVARNMFSSEQESRDIVTAYRDMVKGVDPGAHIRFEPGATHFATLSPESQKLAKSGMMWGYRDLTKDKPLNRSILGIFETPRMREMLQTIAGDEAGYQTGLAEFGRFIDMEDAARKSYQTALGGSQTSRNQQSDESFQVLQAVSNWQRFLSTPGLLGKAWFVVERVVERSFGLSADSARETGRMLLTADPSEQMRIMQAIASRMPADRMQRFNELMGRLLEHYGAGTGVAAGQAGAAVQSPRGPEPTFL